MNSCGRATATIVFIARELSHQPHFSALWEDEVVEETAGGGRLVESEFLQCDKSNTFVGRSGGQVGHVEEANLDKLEQRTSLEEGC